jgi:hypothetical protein
MSAKEIIIILALCILNCLNFQAQEKKQKKQFDYSKSTLFEENTPISIEVFVNKRKLLKDVGDDRKYHPAIVKHVETDGNIKEMKIEIQTRGNFRRNPETCNMAPLHFKIPKEARNDKNIFSGQKKLKLVVPCRQFSEKFQEYVILEYLVYQTYQLIADTALRTRLVNISLTDSLKADKPQNFTGFFIEELDQFSQRTNGLIKEFKRFHPKQVYPYQMIMLDVFQYFIGNTDWSVEVGHNINLLFFDQMVYPYAIPFDFDWSGLVNASYAVPSPVLGINNVQQRLFRGYERKIEDYSNIIQIFNDKKEAIYKLFQNSELLSQKTKSATISYFDDFYQTINNPKLLKKEFIENCRKL